MYILEAANGNAGVDRSGRQLRVAQDLLDIPDVRGKL
jgi:hypothetical protein